MLSRSLALAGALTWLACAQPLYAAEYQTAAAGGGGGNPFTLRCPDDAVLVGVQGSAGSVVDRVQPVCRQIDPSGLLLDGRSAGTAGGGGGTAFILQCPDNHAVSGIDGRASLYVDQLRIKCGPLTAGPRLAASGSVLAGHAGGGGGTAFGPFDCVDNKPGRGLIGRAGTYVDQIRLACDYPPSPLRPLSIYPLRPDRVMGLPLVRGGGVLLLMSLSSDWQHASWYLPVRNSNPAVAHAAGSETVAEVVHYANAGPRTAALDVEGRGVGCTTFEVGFPGAVLPPVDVLIERPTDPHLTLALSIEEWTQNTTSAFGTLTLSTPAPAGGAAIALTSSHPALAPVPPTVTVPQGTRVTTFEIHRIGSGGGCVVISATGNGGSVQSVMLFRTLPRPQLVPPPLQRR
jgi:hypothetical protein